VNNLEQKIERDVDNFLKTRGATKNNEKTTNSTKASPI
jgi:hypothetical protein